MKHKKHSIYISSMNDAWGRLNDFFHTLKKDEPRIWYNVTLDRDRDIIELSTNGIITTIELGDSVEYEDNYFCVLNAKRKIKLMFKRGEAWGKIN